MDIPALSMSLSQIDTTNKVGVAMLSKSLDTMEQMGDGITKMMEASVTPHLGQNIDLSV
ncbi:MAG: YjfB family protein [Lachnospiraceae bacterium]